MSTVDKQQQEIAEQKRMGTGMFVLAWLVLLGLGFFFFKDVLRQQYNPNQKVITQRGQAGASEVVLQRNRFGHYVTAGKINGKPVTFMLDTGATGVAVPTGIADRLGLKRGRAYRTQTANGIGTSYSATLDQVSVGGIELRNIAAGITPGLQTKEVLLGMSFLKHIEFTQRGDTLTLRQ